MVLAGGHQRAAACGLVGVTYRRRRNFGAEGEKLHGDSMAGARGPRHGHLQSRSGARVPGSAVGPVSGHVGAALPCPQFGKG